MKSEDERACDRILIELGKRNARAASSITKLTSSKKFENLSKFERKLERIRLLAVREPGLLREIVVEIKKDQGPSGKSGETSQLINFLERMPNLRGTEGLSYAEFTGGNFKNL